MTGRVIVIGASHGGIAALCALLKQLPANFPSPIFIAQHIGANSAGGLPRILGRAGQLPAVHPKNMEMIQGGRVYVAPPDFHMLVQRGYVWLSRGPRENNVRPAIDPLFRSAASAYGPAVVGVVLTGHLDDGTAGLMAIKDRGGIAVVQDPSEASAPSMPRSAQAHVCIDHCCKLAEMGEILVDLANDDADARASAPDSLIEVETRIAGGEFELADWYDFEKHSVPSGWNCPDCHSALFEALDNRMTRFRCRSGHAFTARSLLEAFAESKERRLAGLFGALIEEATLARRVLNTSADRSVDLLNALTERTRQIEREATKTGQLLRLSSLFDHDAQAIRGSLRDIVDNEMTGSEIRDTEPHG
jgi:two-component system chemotaxis response regulator CheB